MSFESTNSEPLVRAFEKVVTSLNEDVKRLQQLASIRACLSEDGSSENEDPNGVLGSSNSEAITKQLHALDATLSALEGRASMVEEVLDKEEKGLDVLRETRDAALAQKNELLQVIENLPSKLPGDSNPIEAAKVSISAPPSPSETVISNFTTACTVTGPPNFISLVTLEDFTEIQQRGPSNRLTLTAVNEAVENINEVARAKYAVVSNNKASNKIMKLKKNQQVLIDHRETEVPEHEGRPFVSEPVLREQCAFFRSGESTARSTIALLRNLKKIKQIQGGNNTVTYVLLQ